MYRIIAALMLFAFLLPCTPSQAALQGNGVCILDLPQAIKQAGGNLGERLKNQNVSFVLIKGIADRNGILRRNRPILGATLKELSGQEIQTLVWGRYRAETLDQQMRTTEQLMANPDLSGIVIDWEDFIPSNRMVQAVQKLKLLRDKKYPNMQIAVTGFCYPNQHPAIDYKALNGLVDIWMPQAYYGYFHQPPAATLSKMKFQWSWARGQIVPIGQVYKPGLLDSQTHQALPSTSLQQMSVFTKLTLKEYGASCIWRYELMGSTRQAMLGNIKSPSTASTPVTDTGNITHHRFFIFQYLLVLALIAYLAVCRWSFRTVRRGGLRWLRTSTILLIKRRDPRLIACIVVFLIGLFGTLFYHPVAQKPHSDKTLRGVTVVIDPGHGGKDPGCFWKTPNGTFYEAEITYQAANEFGNMLTEHGAEVIFTTHASPVTSPNSQTPPDLPRDAAYTGGASQGKIVHAGKTGLAPRAEIATQVWRDNRQSKVVFIALHVDSMPKNWKGGHVCIDASAPSATGKKLAQLLEDQGRGRQHFMFGPTPSFAEPTLKAPPVLQVRRLYVLRKDKNLVSDRFLFEMGIPNNPHDSWVLRSPSGRQKILSLALQALEQVYGPH